MDLIKGFDLSAFSLALSEILYRGEFCPDMEFYPDLHIKVTQSGKAYRGHYIKHYVPQVSMNNLIHIYSQVAKGSKRAFAKASLLYRMGLGVPRDPVMSALFVHMPYKGRVQLPDGSIITFSDLKVAFKSHLKAAKKRSGTQVYFSEYVDYYSELSTYISADTPREKPSSQIALCGSNADVFATYAESKDHMKLAGLVVMLDGKMFDITYQALHENLVPSRIASKFPGKPGQRITLVGKFNAIGECSDLDEFVSQFLNSYSMSEEQAQKESEARSAIRALRTPEMVSNLKILELAKAKKVLTSRQRIACEKIVPVVKQYKQQLREAQKHLESVEADRNKLPGKVLEFVAYDVLMPSPSTNKYPTGLIYRTVRGAYDSVLEGIRALGFKTMPVAAKKPRNCKNFLGIKSRFNKSTTFWSKDLL